MWSTRSNTKTERYTSTHTNILRKSMFRVLGIDSGTFHSKLLFSPCYTIFTRLVIAKNEKNKTDISNYLRILQVFVVLALNNKNGKLTKQCIFFINHVHISHIT